MKRKIILITATFLLAIFAIAAKRQATATDTPMVRLAVQIKPVWNGETLRFDEVSLRNRAGNTLSVSRLAYLVSEVSLLREDRTAIPLHTDAAYLNPAEQRDSFPLANATLPGRYAGISFCIGPNAKTNHSDPAQYPANHALNPLVNGLHWSWQGGYVFLALEGRYEQPGARLGGYVYHLASDRNRMFITLRKPFTVEKDSTLALTFDLARIFDAVSTITIRPKNGGDLTHSGATDTLAPKLKTNIEHAFALVGVTSAGGLTVPASAAERVTPLQPNTSRYVLNVPAHFPPPALPSDNPLTVEGVALGKKLFFEKRLSGNNTQSCTSCHQAESAFSDRGRALSKGIDGKTGTRNAMPLFNLAWSGAYTWDGRRTRLRDQSLAPIQDAKEMHQTLPRTIAKLKASRIYPALFHRAFGSPGVTAERLGLAIEQYLLTLISADSKFDRALRGEEKFTEEEKQGLYLFITEYDPAREQFGADCFHCHGGNLFTDYRYKNNGLDSTFRDTGRWTVTHQEADRGKFKTPSLRNVERTGPYMHDGRFATLEQVVAHYNSGVHRSATLDPNLAKHPATGINLSKSDQKALVAFLKTLTDARYRPKSATFSHHKSHISP